MKVSIFRDEWYPVYTINTDEDWGDLDIEISEDLYNEYLAVEKQFDIVQAKVREAYNNGND